MPGLRENNTGVTPLTPALSPWERGQVAAIEMAFPLPWGEGQGARGGSSEKDHDNNAK